MLMQFCPYCSSEIPIGSKFCLNCGKEISATASLEEFDNPSNIEYFVEDQQNSHAAEKIGVKRKVSIK